MSIENSLELPEESCTVGRHELLEIAAKDVLIAVWQAIQRGSIDERSRIADTTLVLRDALNPNWPSNPDWLPPELEQNQKPGNAS